MLSNLENNLNSLFLSGNYLGKDGFFDKYKYVIFISFLAGIFANLTSITTPSYGIDTLDAINEDYFNNFLFINMRISSAIFYRLFPFLSIHGISEVVGIFILSLSATLLVYRLNISIIAKAIFTIFFVTHPIWSHLIVFQHQFAYNIIGVLFSAFSFLILIDYVEAKRGRSAILISSILLLVGIFSYQTILFIFAIISSFYALFSYVERTDLKYSFKLLFSATFVAVVTFIIYLLIINIFLGGFNNYQKGFLDEYSSFSEIINHLGIGITVAFRQAFSIEQFKGMNGIPANILLLIFIIVSILKGRKLIPAICIIFFNIAFLVACFFFTIFFDVALWTYINLPIYFALSSLLGYISFNSKIWKVFLLSIFTYILFLNIEYIAINQQAHIISVENDKMHAFRIIDTIYDKAPEVYEGKKPVIFIGRLSSENRHPILNHSSKQFSISIFNTDQVGLFLKLYGLPSNVEVVNSFGYAWKGLKSFFEGFYKGKLDERYLKAVEKSKSMPTYPAKDSISVYNDFVIVKLGNARDLQKKSK